MRLGVTASKLTATPRDWVELPEPMFFHVLDEVEKKCGEEESTTCSGSDPEPLTSSNFEDDVSPFEQQEFVRSKSCFVKNQLEPSRAPFPKRQPPPGIPSLGSA